jgi:general secretion pathway protein J
MPRAALSRQGGFTLIELLVALSIMALMALMSWRGLDAMLRTAQHTRTRSADLLALQAGVAQWVTDLDHLAQTPYAHAVDWDGRVLRVLRTSPVGSPQALQVVAWTLRPQSGSLQWMRWQSAPARQRGELLTAWQQAASWGRATGELVVDRGAPADAPGSAPADALGGAPADVLASAVAVAPARAWQLLYFRSGQWVPAQTLLGSARAVPGASADASSLSFGETPEGLRLILEMPEGAALPGRLVSDWFSPLPGAAR